MTALFQPLSASPIPLHAQLREEVRARILDGSYAAHDRLPPESEMSSLFGVSRITVRQALGDLQKEGVIFRVPGKGTFVSRPTPSQQLTRLEGFGEAMSRQPYEIYNEVIDQLRVAASAVVAQRLGLAEGTPVSQIRRIRHLNRAPVSYETTFVTDAIGERLRHEDLARRDIFLILENDYGIALGHADVAIDAVNASPVMAAALQVGQGSALLRMERLTHTAAGQPLDFEYLYFRGDAFQHRLQIARSKGASTLGQ